MIESLISDQKAGRLMNDHAKLLRGLLAAVVDLDEGAAPKDSQAGAARRGRGRLRLLR